MKSLDLNSLKSTLSVLGIDNGILDNINENTVDSVLSGDIKALLPLLPLFLKNFNLGGFNPPETKNNLEETVEDLSPITDIANVEIFSTLKNYFN